MRYPFKIIEDFSQKKMVLMAGPRQVGKTTLAKEWVQSGEYFNWDIPEHRKTLLSHDFMAQHTSGRLVLDEIHKYGRWKAWLKGLYDRNAPKLKILVTGSARLDLFQKGGDSLLGRYELVHLHPLTVGELSSGGIVPPPSDWRVLGQRPTNNVWDRLEQFGGFPEPYFQADPLQYQRWETRRRELLVREDLRELTQIKELSLMEHLTLLLPERVGSPLSLNNLRQELGVAHDTVNSWIRSLERLYYCYRISPYYRKISRGLRKEQKLYLWNWAEIADPAARFENMVASHLFKSVQLWNDLGYGAFELCYVRDKEKREIDFLITRARKPWVFIEARETDRRPSENFRMLDQIGWKGPSIQVIRTQNIDEFFGAVRIVSADTFLSQLN